MVSKDDDENYKPKRAASAVDDDSDLADLLGEQQRHNGNGKTPSPRRNTWFYPRGNAGIFEYISAYISLCCYYHPVICGSIVVLLAAVVVLLLTNLVFNPIEEFGVIHNAQALASIQSKYDLTMGKIDHWCLEGGDENCFCEDPLTPMSRIEHRSWVEAFNTNKKIVGRFKNPLEAVDLDVAFLGDSVIEAMGGNWMGAQRTPELKTLENIFENHFGGTTGTAAQRGVALGIAGTFRYVH
jgi:hypothetical protein